jgi:hypothetical protein
VSTPEIRLHENSRVVEDGQRSASATASQRESGGTLVRHPGIEYTTANPNTGLHTAKTVVSRAFSNQPLLARQCQKFCVGRQNVPHRVLVFPSGLDLLAHVLYQMLWNVLNVFLSFRHVSQ